MAQAECERRGWTLGFLFEDAGYSAKNLKRPGIGSALEALEKREAAGLVVAKLDRLSRSMLDFTAIMATAQRQTWAIVALDCAVDTTTPAGEAMAHVLATFAHFERRLIGQRTREALAVKRAAGVRLGRPPEIPEPVAARIREARSSGKRCVRSPKDWQPKACPQREVACGSLNGPPGTRKGDSMTDDNKRVPPESWSVEPVADFRFYLNRPLPTYEDDDDPGAGTDHAEGDREGPRDGHDDERDDDSGGC
jgi:DNA invertase Pin-like site-specific DNA recombinase